MERTRNDQRVKYFRSILFLCCCCRHNWSFITRMFDAGDAIVTGVMMSGILIQDILTEHDNKRIEPTYQARTSVKLK